MTGLWILAGLAIGMLSLAVLFAALAVLVRAIASLLPPAGQLLADVTTLRETAAARAEEHRRDVERDRHGMTISGIPPAPTSDEPRERMRPRPVTVDGPTSADLPPVIVGDVDRFDLAAAEEFVGRPMAPGSRHAAPPPGEQVEGER